MLCSYVVGFYWPGIKPCQDVSVDHYFLYGALVYLCFLDCARIFPMHSSSFLLKFLEKNKKIKKIVRVLQTVLLVFFFCFANRISFKLDIIS